MLCFPTVQADNRALCFGKRVNGLQIAPMFVSYTGMDFVFPRLKSGTVGTF